MAKNKTFKVLASVTALVGIVGASLTGVNGNAQANSTVELVIDAGVTTMYAPDSTLNSDLCTVADDGNNVNAIQLNGSNLAVTCDGDERLANFTAGLTVQSSRQTADTVLNDILFEDLSGNAAPTYSVTLKGVTDLVGVNNTIALGSNPDNLASAEGVLGAPTAGNAGKLFLYVDPTDAGAEVSALAPQSAKTALTADPNIITPNASAHTVIAAGAALDLSIYSSTAPVTPGRYTMNGLKQYVRIPAFVAADTYTMTQTYDIVVG